MRIPIARPRLTCRKTLLPVLLAGALVLPACDLNTNRQPQAAVGSQGAQPTATARAGQAARSEVAGVQTGAQPNVARSAGAAAVVYRQAGASVVNITSLAVVRSQLGSSTSAQPRGTGSGFFIDRDGHIVTNNHVVEDSDQLSVTFQDKTTVPARLVGRDPDNDLAVIRVDPNATDDSGRKIADLIKPVALGDSDRIEIGEEAIAIGSPLGLQQTVTLGIVSALRQPSEQIAPGEELPLLGGAVQTDAAINPGNSGGPLFNANAEVIGVNSAGLAPAGSSIGLNFAIPINVVKRVVPELINTGCYRHPLIGISTLPLSQMGPALKQQLGIPTSLRGLLVQEASAGAARAGVRGGSRQINAGGTPLLVGGDIITAIDGHPVATGGDLRAYALNAKRPGDTVTLALLRDGQQTQVTVTLSQRPNDLCR
ncbi:MAG TPA: trypsin-like peptidase domain-containing protein [Chloroflexota bacterium]|nr:trypsin-like peptidase domain-containing protein [Chloroflexota bacterium]